MYREKTGEREGKKSQLAWARQVGGIQIVTICTYIAHKHICVWVCVWFVQSIINRKTIHNNQYFFYYGQRRTHNTYNSPFVLLIFAFDFLSKIPYFERWHFRQIKYGSRIIHISYLCYGPLMIIVRFNHSRFSIFKYGINWDFIYRYVSKCPLTHNKCIMANVDISLNIESIPHYFFDDNHPLQLIIY